MLCSLRSKGSSFIAYLRHVSGGKRFFIAFAFGSAMALTMPPFNLFPLLWIGLPAAVLLIGGAKNALQAFFVGWGFAFGFLVFGLYWIAASMFVDIKQFWWAVPFAVAGLPAFLAVYYGLAGALFKKLGLGGVPGAVAFGLLWFLADYARGHLFTGFPWILLGYTWSGVLPVLQITSVVGIYGLTLITAVAASLPSALVGRGGERSPTDIRRDERERSFAFFVLAASLFFLGCLAGWGVIRLDTTELKTLPFVHVRLVQPNINQALKWREDEREKNFEELIALSATEKGKPVTHIFWPETASTFFLGEEPRRRKQIASQMPKNARVMTGVIRRETDESGAYRYYNSMVALDPMGRITAEYDKAHLVPFGEYMPMRSILPVQALAASAVDFSSGPGARSLRVPGIPLFSPLICYEAIFPGDVVDENDRPGFMVNLTNDAWYGRTTGPYQHFAITRVRAIEEGMPLLRVANTGISGIIDPLGRVEAMLDLGDKGIVDGDLHKALYPTLFAEWGERIVWLGFFLLLIGNAHGAINLRIKKDQYKDT